MDPYIDWKETYWRRMEKGRAMCWSSEKGRSCNAVIGIFVKLILCLESLHDAHISSRKACSMGSVDADRH